MTAAEQPGRFELATVAFFGRTFAEYLEMFALGESDLAHRSILDVAAGPGSFVAEATARGFSATACDPRYAGDAAAILAQGRADLEACRAQIGSRPGTLVYADIDAFYAAKHRALERFVADFTPGRASGRYVPGALPALPFADRSFDLVLCANLLFVYAPLADGGMSRTADFGLDFHLRAVAELARVARHEVRIPGGHTWSIPPRPHPYLPPLADRLTALGFTPDLVPSSYDDGCSAADPACSRVLVARR